ncbi:acetyl-CoA C-acetyltransferase [Roseateles sp.]|uniref:acetyl-CoA C-acetyltransferase n=1 Tax=Roseateles sp. TaxID=1971397 RepID=UPI00286CE200|nr:acetyl-CoA C-acetyltransferase [Roseateles sp.]
MRKVAIVAPVRTAVGAFGGALRGFEASQLAAVVVREILTRSGLDPARVEDVVFAQSYANSEHPCIGRWAALEAGLPIEVPGMQLDRRCGGGLQAIATAAMMVQSEVADVVIAGGVECMSNIEYYTTDMRWGKRSGSSRLHDRLDRGRERSQPVERFGHISGMIETAENLAREWQITREEADAYAMSSQQRAAAAWSSGKFAGEVVPVLLPQKNGETVSFMQDEGIRADTSLEGLARLRPLVDQGTVTAGNAAQQNDAAAACLVVAADKLAALNLEPMATLVGWTVVGCHPAHMGIGPVPAIRRLLDRTGLKLDAMDLIEINEAFACQVLSVLKGLALSDRERINVNGSGISLGHPVGATGARILTTLLHEMQRRGSRYGLESMCIGGGQGMAAIFERP